MQVASLGFLAARSELPQTLPANVLYSVLPLAGGVLLGLALFGRVSDAVFRRALLFVLLASGLSYLL
jgi:hypothetical protein